MADPSRATITIRPALRSDIPALADMSLLAWEHDALCKWVWQFRKEYPISFRNSYVRAYRRRLTQFNVVNIVAVDQDGKIAGNGIFEYQPGAKEKGYWKGEHERVKQHRRETRAMEQSSLGLETLDTCNTWLERQASVLEFKYVNGLRLNRALNLERDIAFRRACYQDSPFETHPAFEGKAKWHVAVIVVHPRYQRRGIGGQLLRWGRNIAEQENLPSVLEASEDGKGLYEKEGYRTWALRQIFQIEDESLPEEDRDPRTPFMLWTPEDRREEFGEDENDNKA